MANSPSGQSMVERIVRVLESFDSDRVAQTPAEIARRTGIPGSTAHRLVAELVSRGLLERDDQGAIRIGMRLWELTTRGSHALGLRQLALPFMEEVQAKVREHTQLGVLEHDEVLFIERLSRRGSVSNVTTIAGRLPVNASSSGLVLLAFAPADYQEHILSSPLTALTPDTIVDPALLRRTLSQVRRLGFAAAPGSIESATTGIAVPVSDGATVVAALGVVVPRDDEHREQRVVQLRVAADGISAAINASVFSSR